MMYPLTGKLARLSREFRFLDKLCYCHRRYRFFCVYFVLACPRFDLRRYSGFFDCPERFLNMQIVYDHGGAGCGRFHVHGSSMLSVGNSDRNWKYVFGFWQCGWSLGRILPSVNTTALPGQDSLALVVVDQNEVSANVNSRVPSGGDLQAYTSTINHSKRLHNDLQSLGLKIKWHEDKIKSLRAQSNILYDSILEKRVILGMYHSSAAPIAEDSSLSNGGEDETTEQILKHDKSAAGIWWQLKNIHGTQAPILALSKDVIGIVATLGKVDDENLSRLLSEYLGAENMLAIVCQTRQGLKALETYDRAGSIDESAGLHGLGSSIGRTLNGRFLFICLEDLRPYIGDFVADDSQRRLDLFKPRLPSGECPRGFLDFAVNMVNIETTHLVCSTPSGHGLRETLFYHLFSRTQVYSTRVDMLRARPLITDGAISLDGGIIRAPGMYSLGRREDVDVRFPVPSGASSRPTNYREIENRMKDLKWKREKLLEDLRQERQMLDHAKLDFERKKQEFFMFLGQSSSYATWLGNARSNLKVMR